MTNPDLEPQAERERELKVVGVEVDEYLSGIPLSGWENIRSALNAFASGKPRRSRATEDHNLKAYTEMHPLAGMLFLQTNRREPENSFVDRLLKEAEPAVKERGRWSRSYDYDGQGSFHKTSVEIEDITPVDEKTNDGLYLLGLNAAYVGKGVEDGLAEYLGVEQGLQRKSVHVKLEPEGNQFAIDFDKVAQKLQPLLPQLHSETEAGPENFFLNLLSAVIKSPETETALTGEEIVRQMLAADSYRSRDANPIVLGTKDIKDDRVEVALELGRVGDRYDWRGGNRDRELWNIDGATVRGPLAQSYQEEGKPELPSLILTVRRAAQKDEYSRLPVVNPDVKTEMNLLANQIAALFGQVSK